MKKIFVFLLLMVVSFALKAQYPIQQNLGSNNTLIRLGSTYGGALKGNLIQGVYADTTEANTGYIDLYPGAIIFSTGNATMYVRNAAADGWIALATGLSAINIYTSDGTLTGNRTLAGVGNSLTFSGLSDFLVEDATGEIKLGTSEFNRLRISSGFTAFISLDADSLLMTRLPQSQLLSTDSVLVRTADFKVKTRAVSSIGSTYTAGNGLTLSGSQFKLGGTLTENTTITGDATNKLVLQGYNASNDGYLNIGQDAGYLQFGSASFTPSYESEIYSGNIELGLRTSGNIYLDARDIYTIGVPTVSSTTGRKVALIDTATGKVERIDPASLVTTPTLQQVLTAGSTLTTDGSVDVNDNNFEFINANEFSIVTKNDGIQLESTALGLSSSMTIENDSVTLRPNTGIANIDTLRTWSGISDTTHKKPMTWDTRNGRWEYAANWYGGGGGTPTLQQVLTAGSTLTGNNTVDADGNVLAFTGNYTKFDSLFVSNGTANEDYLIKHRNNLGLGFPVVNITPPGTTARNIAFDIMPVGSPGNYSDNGIAWLDVCDSDISDGSGAVVAARVGVTTSAVQFGSREFGGATAKPIQFVIGSSTKAQIDASTNTGSFNIGKITQSQDISSDYVGYSLFNTNNSTSGGDAIFFIGQSIGSLTHGFLRYNNDASATQGSKEPTSFQIAANAGATGGLNIASLANTRGKIKFFIGSSGGVEAMRIDSNRRVGIGTSTPAQILDVVGNIKSTGFIELSESSLPSTPASGLIRVSPNTSNSKIYNTDDTGKSAQLIQDLQMIFGAGSGADADTTAFTTSAIYGSFYNDADTIVVTSFRAVLQGTSPDVTYKIWYNDSLNVEAGATALVTAGSQVTNTTTGTNVTSFDVTKIPPGVWVWVKTSTVATKPKYFSLTLNGYRK